MYYGNIKNIDTSDGEGVRVSLFVSGCRNKCKGCFSSQTWDFKFGNLYTQDTTIYIHQLLSKDYIKGLSLLGGDPFEPENAKELVKIMKELISFNDIKDKVINETWAWSGYTFEEIIKYNDERTELLKMLKVLVDGKFIEELKDLSLKFRGSSNQRIINVQESLKQNKIIHYYQE